MQAFIWSDQQAYFFVGKVFYRWNREINSVDAGYPMRISSADGWPGVPDNVDAALLYKQDGETKVLPAKTEVQIAYKAQTVASGTSLSGPVMIRHVVGKTYFFKGANYYRYNNTDHRVDSGQHLQSIKK